MLFFSALVPCSSGCGGASDLPTSYRTCENPGDQLRYGSTTLILEKCTNTWIDFLDVAEWQSKIAAGDIMVFPDGTIKVAEPTQSPFVINGRQDKAIGDVAYLVNYDTTWFPLDTSDSRFFQTVWYNGNRYRIMWMDINGRLTVPLEWATVVDAGSPATVADYAAGFAFSMTKIPAKIAGESNTAKWNFEIEIQAREVLQEVIIPGLAPIITAI